MKEIWKDIIGYESLYQVSNLGNVKTLRKNKLLRKEIHKGYYEISLCKNGNVNHYRVHRLVAQAFIPNPDNKPQINHKDGIKTNNCIDNLEWVTHKENMNHARKNKLISEKGIICSINAMCNATKKPIIQLKNGLIIKEYDSISKASVETKIAAPHICNTLKGKRKSAGGYNWQYK